MFIKIVYLLLSQNAKSKINNFLGAKKVLYPRRKMFIITNDFGECQIPLILDSKYIHTDVKKSISRVDLKLEYYLGESNDYLNIADIKVDRLFLLQ